MTEHDVARMRRALLEAYGAGVHAVEGEQVTARWLQAHPPAGPVALIALGKAAGAMTRGAQAALGPDLTSGLVVTKAGHADVDGLDPSRLRIVESAHPVPDQSSLAAGGALLGFVEQLPPDRPVVVLISGGASALVEVPVDGVTLDDLARVNGWLLANGLPIGQMNAVRRRLSRLKGGGLARLLAPRDVLGLLISDVEGDDPAVIGSGPLSVPADPGLPADLPGWLRALVPDLPPSSGSVGTPPRVEIVACLDDALVAAEQTLRAAGIPVRRHTRHFAEDIDAVVAAVRDTMLGAPGEVQLWGGEATLVLPARPGRGGRNQQLALRLAVEMAGSRPAVALSAGTDGTDGPTDDAGALVDHRTIARGDREGLVVSDFLARADAGRYLEQTGDLVTTGPTGTNVTDIVMAWRSG